MRKLQFITVGLFLGMQCACNKNAHVANVEGSIGGVAAYTLYGSSRAAGDYLLLSKDSTIKKIAYGGRIFTFIHFSSSPNRIFIRDTIAAVGSGELTKGASPSFVFDTVYTPYAFKSRSYKAD